MIAPNPYRDPRVQPQKSLWLPRLCRQHWVSLRAGSGPIFWASASSPSPWIASVDEVRQRARRAKYENLSSGIITTQTTIVRHQCYCARTWDQTLGRARFKQAPIGKRSTLTVASAHDYINKGQIGDSSKFLTVIGSARRLDVLWEKVARRAG